MNLYLNYYAETGAPRGDNLGGYSILCAESKDRLVALRHDRPLAAAVREGKYQALLPPPRAARHHPPNSSA
jgi:hypothetical protein